MKCMEKRAADEIGDGEVLTLKSTPDDAATEALTADTQKSVPSASDIAEKAVTDEPASPDDGEARQSKY